MSSTYRSASSLLGPSLAPRRMGEGEHREINREEGQAFRVFDEHQ